MQRVAYAYYIIVYTIGTDMTSTMTLKCNIIWTAFRIRTCVIDYFIFDPGRTMFPTGPWEENFFKKRPNRSFIIMLITADRFKTKIKAAAIFHAFPPDKNIPSSNHLVVQKRIMCEFFFIWVILLFFHSVVATTWIPCSLVLQLNEPYILYRPAVNQTIVVLSRCSHICRVLLQ